MEIPQSEIKERGKLTAADGKKYKSDMLDYNGIIALGKTFPGTKANRFMEWFKIFPPISKKAIPSLSKQ